MQANPPGAEFLTTISKFRERKKISSSLVYVLHSRATTVKKCTKKHDKRAKLLFCLDKLLLFRTFSLTSPSWYLKLLSAIKTTTQSSIQPQHCQIRHLRNVRETGPSQPFTKTSETVTRDTGSSTLGTRGYYKDLTETGNGARKVSGTQGKGPEEFPMNKWITAYLKSHLEKCLYLSLSTIN